MSGAALAREQMAALRIEYARGKLTTEQLETELEFWLAVERCPLCGELLCSAHYERFYGSW